MKRAIQVFETLLNTSQYNRLNNQRNVSNQNLGRYTCVIKQRPRNLTFTSSFKIKQQKTSGETRLSGF